MKPPALCPICKEPLPSDQDAHAHPAHPSCEQVANTIFDGAIDLMRAEMAARDAISRQDAA